MPSPSLPKANEMFDGLEEVELAAALTRRNITYFPVVPGRVEFAVEVRQFLLETRPEVLAIELPAPLRSPYLKAIARFPELSIIRYPDPVDPLQWVYIPVEPTDPFMEALRTAHELGIRIELIEPNWGDRPHIGDAYPDSYAIQTIGRERYINGFRLQKNEPTEEMIEHAEAMARKLQGLHPDREVVAVVSLNMLDLILDAMELPQERDIEPRGSAYLAELCNAHPDCLAEITVEFPFLIDRYNRYRANLSGEPQFLDRIKTQLAVLETAEVAYWRNGEGRLDSWQYRQIAKFARNLAHSSGELAADIVDLTLASRGVVDDNYASHVWHALNHYPEQQLESELFTLTVAAQEIWCRKRRIRLHRRQRPELCSRPATPGAVVAIFDEDPEDSRHPLKSSEPDMAFYGNEASETGGVLLCQLPGDIWSDARFDAAESKAERLLLAALQHSSARKITYIAAKPPRRLMREIAGHWNRQIEHVPLGQVPPKRLALLRRRAAVPQPASAFSGVRPNGAA